jgi:ankyrin repeat protein
VRLLLDNKAHVNESNTYDWPVLHGTVENGHDIVVRILLEKGLASARLGKDRQHCLWQSIMGTKR